jgi:hypothetical protein
MTSDKNDPLASLFTDDAQAINREQLALLLSPFLSIDRESNELVFKADFNKIKGNDSKIEILLAGAKARSLFLNLPDGLLPKEIIATSILPIGSIKSSLKNLSDNHKIKKDKEGRYSVPTYRISELSKQFNK